MSTNGSGKKTITPTMYVTIAAIAAIVIAGIWYLARDTSSTSFPIADDFIEILEQPLFQANYDYIDPAVWEHTENAEHTINSSQGKEDGQEKITLGIIQDPGISQLFYFATIDETDSDEHFLGVYLYDIDSRNWERLYKETNIIKEPRDRKFHYSVLGFDDDRLILKRTSLDVTMKPCEDPLLTDKETTMVEGKETVINSPLLAMDLQNPYTRWEEHSLSDKVRDIVERRKEDCES